MKYKLDIKKKLREKQLIEEFVRICPEYQDYSFDSFTENPDVIYKSKNGLMGFDSVIISDDQSSVQCVYSPDLCSLTIPANLPHDERLNQIEVFFTNKLFSHLRNYSIPTVLVFSIVDTQSTSFEDIVAIAKRFALPKLEQFNIQAYYICNHNNYVKIASSV